MADNEEASIAALINEQPQQDSSQTTVIVEDQVAAPATPFEGLQNHLREHPYDIVAWQDLVNIAEDSGDLKLINTAYDSLLKVYPNTVSLQLKLTSLKTSDSGLCLCCVFLSLCATLFDILPLPCIVSPDS
jgi:hypothetical protein